MDNTALAILVVGFFVVLIATIAMMYVYQSSPRRHKYWPGPYPKPQPQPLVGGCSGTEYGCCPDGRTARINAFGSNCYR